MLTKQSYNCLAINKYIKLKTLLNRTILPFLIFALLPLYSIAEENSNKGLQPNSILETKHQQKPIDPKIKTKTIIQKTEVNIIQKKSTLTSTSPIKNNPISQKVIKKINTKQNPTVANSLSQKDKSLNIITNKTNNIIKNIDKKKPKFLSSKMSIMSQKSESDKIYEALEAFQKGVPLIEKIEIKEKTQNKRQKDRYSHLRLSAMLFLSNTNWTVWLNSKKINYRTNNKNNEIYIKNISNNKIDIIWKMNLTKWKFLAKKFDRKDIPNTNKNNEVILEFSLKPQQIYLIPKNKVVANVKINQIEFD